jgi:hypothetical protein
VNQPVQSSSSRTERAFATQTASTARSASTSQQTQALAAPGCALIHTTSPTATPATTVLHSAIRWCAVRTHDSASTTDELTQQNALVGVLVPVDRLPFSLPTRTGTDATSHRTPAPLRAFQPSQIRTNACSSRTRNTTLVWSDSNSWSKTVKRRRRLHRHGRRFRLCGPRLAQASWGGAGANDSAMASINASRRGAGPSP